MAFTGAGSRAADHTGRRWHAEKISGAWQQVAGIFFADSDFGSAVAGALFGVFLNQGEVCSAGSRILVERSIYRRFLDAMVEKARTIRVGNGLDRETQMGPLITETHRARVRGYQEIGKGEAKLALGGGVPAGEPFARGFFVEPTIFYDVDNRARIAQEEIFGPVACVIPFDNEDAALKIANDTRTMDWRPPSGPRCLQGDARRPRAARRRSVGQPDASQRHRSAVGRLQAEWFRPRRSVN